MALCALYGSKFKIIRLYANCYARATSEYVRGFSDRSARSSARSSAGNKGSRVGSSFDTASNTITATGSVVRFCWYGRFLSTVTNASNPSVASASSLPFFTPAQPISTTVRTSWLGKERRNLTGIDSSSSNRIRRQTFSGRLKYSYGFFSGYRWKIFERGCTLQIVKEVLDKNTGIREAKRSAHYFWVATDERCVHVDLLFG